MNSHTVTPLSRWASWLTGLLLVLIPFQAFLTVWASSLAGHYTALRLWPEIVLMVLCGLAVYVFIKDEPRRQKLLKDKLFIALLCYIVVIFTWGLVAKLTGGVNWPALAQGWITDARLPLSLLATWLLAPQLTGLVKRWWRWLLLPAGLVVIFGLLQATVLPADFLKHFGYGPATIQPIETVDKKAAYQRVQSTLRGANPLGAYLVIVVTAVLAGLIKLPRRYRGWLIGLLAASGVTLFFTYSRSAYLGAVVAAAGLIWWSIKSQRWRRWLLIGLAAFMVVAAGSIWLFRHNDRLQNVFFHTDETSQSSTSSNAQRSSALKGGLHDVLFEPLGRGVGTAGPASAHNYDNGRIAENYFLQIGQEMGWAGLSLFVIIYVTIGYRLWQRRSQPLARAWLAALIGLTLVNMLSHAWADDTLAFIWWLPAGWLLDSAILPLKAKTKNDQKIT